MNAGTDITKSPGARLSAKKASSPRAPGGLKNGGKERCRSNPIFAGLTQAGLRKEAKPILDTSSDVGTKQRGFKKVFSFTNSCAPSNKRPRLRRTDAGIAAVIDSGIGDTVPAIGPVVTVAPFCRARV